MRLLLSRLRCARVLLPWYDSAAPLPSATVTLTISSGLHTSPTSHYHTTLPSAGMVSNFFAPGGPIRNVLNQFGMLNISRARLRGSGYMLYAGTVDTVDYDQFFDLCELPDTFYSWYLVTELHVWMLCVRLSDDGAEGKFCRDQLMTAMWEDLDTRAKKLGPMVASLRNEQIQETSHHFKAALVGYDEGLADDRVLAGALWRRLFARGGSDATRLETLLAFVRREQGRLDRLSRDSLLMRPNNCWGSLR